MGDPKLPPEQWRPLFDKIGVEFGYRPLATRINMDHTKVRRILRGDRTSHEAIKELADGLGIDPTEVYRLRGEEPVEPFTLPDEAGRLTGSERRVIRAMVRALLDARESGNAVEATPQPRTPGEAAESEKTQAADGRDQRQADHDLAARDTGGISESEQTRRDMDQQGEAPDPDGPEDGA
ncbi:hypothetical protein A5788_22165 [Gordonia sp. 852002-50816_SCH5313054-c]|uniref:hypothetical protein n=1 Tax=unclassified Gordonia (in: high G+C Gram-positive bacteria) TaxID=2657482 RepID=UPI0007E9AEE7|nr:MULTISPECIES: hypothetical protein [unclassified Gordonia (in: high G+C Gram-positive bacteria)]OBC12146.1 hypothetical protein A5788_22165 [Gordonia sp. 852002-50816_SCH5313054-c]OBC17571.1 hypothetical protein A5786_18785 [Gordonia sp. 852002-50816_SCH5313054-a]